jgi:membrane protein
MGWRHRFPRLARLVGWALRVDARFDRARTFGLAAEMAFYLFLSLVPLAAVAGLVVAKVAVHNRAALDPPLAALPPVVSTFVAEQLASVAAWNGGTVALPAAVVFVWSASSGVLAIFEALEVQTQSKRAWWKQRLYAVSACVGLSIGVAVVTLLSTGIAWIFSALGRALPFVASVESGFVGSTVRWIVSVALDFGLMVALYALGVPREKGRSRPPLAPGAALAVALQAALAWGYGLYLSTLGSADAYSGALWTIAVTMTALYLLALTILFGAELNHELAVRRALAPTRRPPSRLDLRAVPRHAGLAARASRIETTRARTRDRDRSLLQ